MRTATPMGVLAAVQAHRQRQARGVAVGGHHQRGVEGHLALVSPSLACTPVIRPVRRFDGARPRCTARTGALRPSAPAAQLLVEIVALADQTVIRVRGEVGPVQLEPHPPPMMRRPLLRSQPASSRCRCPSTRAAWWHGREAVAAHLLARERGLLQQQDIEPGLRQVVAVVEPAGPAPTTITSAVCSVRGWGSVTAGLPKAPTATATRAPAAVNAPKSSAKTMC